MSMAFISEPFTMADGVSRALLWTAAAWAFAPEAKLELWQPAKISIKHKNNKEVLKAFNLITTISPWGCSLKQKPLWHSKNMPNPILSHSFFFVKFFPKKPTPPWSPFSPAQAG
ncbi:MAG: hypothetical protein IIT73_00290 [Treponema sp.]|nr:hypothetical protein [Treponema sp.]